MSGIVDEVLTGPVAGVIGVGIVGAGAIVVGSAVVALGAAVLGTGALGVAAVISTKKLFEGIKDEIHYMKNIAIEEKRRYEAASEAYLKKIAENKELQIAYINQIRTSINKEILGLNESNIEKIIKFDNEEQISFFMSLSHIEYYINSVNDLISMLDDEDFDFSELSDAIITSKKKIQIAIQTKDVEVLDKAILTIQKTLSSNKPNIYRYLEENSIQKVERVDTLIFTIENELSLPYQMIFKNELAEEIKLFISSSSDETLKNELFELQKEVLSIAENVSNLHEIPQTKEVLSAANSVNEILQDPKLSLETKFEQAKERLRILKELYIDIQSINQGIFEYKREYDYYFQLLAIANQFLNKKLPPYQFNIEQPQQSIQRIKDMIEDVEPQVRKRQEMNQTRHHLREVLSNLKYEFITSQESTVNGYYVAHQIYHIDNGNVLNVKVSEDGHLRFQITGVKFVGAAIDKNSILETQKQFCEQLPEINEALLNKGYGIDLLEEIEPNLEYIEEIQLPKNTEINKVQVIKSAKFKKQAQKESKVLYKE
jgi:hypothetical protein